MHLHYCGWCRQLLHLHQNLTLETQDRCILNFIYIMIVEIDIRADMIGRTGLGRLAGIGQHQQRAQRGSRLNG